MTAYRRSLSRAPQARFQPMPLVAVLLNMLGRRRPRKPAPLPQNVDWERDEPMSGLS